MSEREYNELKLKAAKYDALEAGGVDNWKWYSEAMAEFYSDEDEDPHRE